MPQRPKMMARGGVRVTSDGMDMDMDKDKVDNPSQLVVHRHPINCEVMMVRTTDGHLLASIIHDGRRLHHHRRFLCSQTE